VDIFIQDAIGYSVKQAQERLEAAARDVRKEIVAWGNTNVGARMYKSALQVAFTSHRSVSFVKW
jgi:hypothetical protein